MRPFGGEGCSCPERSRSGGTSTNFRRRHANRPAEERDQLDGGDADWANALLRKHGEALAHSRATPLRGETTVLDADAQAELQALGY